MKTPDDADVDAPEPASPNPDETGPGRAPSAKLVPILLGVFALVATFNAPRRDFWGDEAVHAQVTREMIEASDSVDGWLVPTLGGSPYLAKPPLAFWLSALSGSIPDLDPHLAYRLPSLLCGLLSLWLTYWLGRKMFDRSVGVLAMAMQGTTLVFFFDASWAGADLVFACFLQLAISCFLVRAHGDSNGKLVWIGWIGLAAASMTKSPLLACGLTFGVLVATLFFGGGVSSLGRGFGRFARRTPTVMYLILAGAWYVYIFSGTEHGTALFEDHWQRQHFERFVGDLDDAHSPLFYVVAILVGFLPWSLFLGLGLLHAKDRTSRDGQRACLFWFLFVLLALTIVSSKRVSYLLPLIPAMSLMTASAFLETKERFSLWEDYLRDQFFHVVPWLLKVPAILALLLAIASLAGLHEKIESEWLNKLFADDENRSTILVLLTICGVAAWITALRMEKELEGTDRWRRALELARVTVFLFFVGSFLLPALDPVQSARSFLVSVNETVDTSTLATYGLDRPAAVRYYLPEREILHFDRLPVIEESDADGPRAKLKAYLSSTKKVYLLASADEVEGLKTQFPGTFSRMAEVDRGRMGIRGDFVLLSAENP
jgi:4-amino-4-deoxy-L-arabinose transferase-like glycosyltransferase